MQLSLVVPRKRLFVSLLTISLLAVAFFAVIIWYLSDYTMYTYRRVFLVLAVMLAVTVFFLVSLGVGGLVLMLWNGREITFINSIANTAVNLLFPVALQLGKLFGIKENKIKSSFIEVNNQLVRLRKNRIKPSELLLLVPHCIQFSGCSHKITGQMSNCKRCGSCQVSELLKLKDFYQANIAIATGGTLARKYVLEYRPKVVIAIACEQDLTSGVLDCYPLPVLGILNQRPHGPCQDTVVQIDSIRDEIIRITEGR
jgi:hypothetical protein